jgi:hypothetical protein
MGLDIRIPIGAMFSILGLLLVVFGALANSEIYKKSLEINVNLWWGIVMLVFGALMAYFGKRADRRASENTAPRSASRH